MTKSNNRQAQTEAFYQAPHRLMTYVELGFLQPKSLALYQSLLKHKPEHFEHRQCLIKYAYVNHSNIDRFLYELVMYGMVEMKKNNNGFRGHSYRAVRNWKLFTLPNIDEEITKSSNHEITKRDRDDHEITNQRSRNVTLSNNNNNNNINSLTLLNQKGMINKYFVFSEKSSRLKPHVERWIEIASDEIDFEYLVHAAAKSYANQHESKHGHKPMEPIRASNQKFLDVFTNRLMQPKAWEQHKKHFPNPFVERAVDDPELNSLDESLQGLDEPTLEYEYQDDPSFSDMPY